jgi:hypothetical protein
VSRKADRKRFDVFFFRIHASIVQQKWMHVKWLQFPCAPAPKKGTALLSPCLEGRGFTGRVDKSRWSPFPSTQGRDH